MKKGLLLGALAATALWSGAALAGDDQAATDTQVNQDTSQVNQDAWRDSTVPDQNTGIGGSGDTAATTTDIPSSTDTASTATTPAQNPGAVTVDPGNGQKVIVNPGDGQNVTVQTAPNDAPVQTAQPAYLPAQPTPVVQEESSSSRHLRGVSVVANAGIEGYTGGLAPRIDPGLTYGASLGLRPSKVFGIELGYSGAVNEVTTPGNVNAANGADIIRNGGQAIATVGLTASPTQPYLLAGVGVNSYQVRGATAALGFRNDVDGDIPLGAGLRTQFGAFTADARVGYHVPFDDQFATGVAARDVVGLNSEAAGRYQGTLNFGSTF